MTGPSRLARLRRTVFARHSHPCSAWSRWATTPLVLLPVWTRRWWHAGLVAVWFLVNPVIFAPPTDDRAWATRAMLGEECWIVDRPRDLGLGVNVVAGGAAVVAVIAARRRRPVPAAVATAVQMALTLVYWRFMARYYDVRNRDRNRHRATGRG